MAHIIGFPTDRIPSIPVKEGKRDVPPVFLEQLDAVRSMKFVEGVEYSELPAPRGIADYGFGVELAIGAGRTGTGASGADDTQGFMGWITVNYSLQERPEWNSQWRCTGYFRQPVIDGDERSLVTQIYWDYAYGVLTPLASGSVNGAVSLSENEFFDSESSQELSAPVSSAELRASWSPAMRDASGERMNASDQINAWAELMMRAAGKSIVLRGNKAASQ